MRKLTSLKKLTSLIVLLLALGLVMAGCGSSEQEAEKEPAQESSQEVKEPVKFKIGHATWVGYAPLYIAKEKGFFEKYNIDPELLIIEDESQYAAAVTSGELQGLCNVVDREVIHFSKGAPINFVLAMDESSGGDGIVASEAIKSVADLKGKTVGLDKSSTSYFFFLSVLDKNGLKEDEVTIQEMSAGDAGAAFVAGKLDAAVTWEPWLSKAGERKGGHVLVTSKDYPRTIVDVITLRQDFSNENPEAVTGLVKAWYDAIDFYKQNPDEGNQIMAKALQLEEAELADMAKGVQFFGREDNNAFFGNASDSDSIWALAGTAARFWQDKKIIDGEIDINKLINDKFVKEAAE